MLKIGGLELSSRLVLAPLSGVSDLPFRLINRRHGCELAFVEMTSTHALVRRNPRTLRMIETVAEDRPLGIQLLCADHESLRASVEIVNRGGYAVVDFNAACPVRKVIRRGEGAALMREPRKLRELLKTLVRAAQAPVTVKIRAGWDAQSVNAREVALHAEDAGISALFIHGRTRSQGYGGAVDYAVIGEVKEALSVPVIASGDVFGPAPAKRMLDETGCDGLVMARGAMGNPWIFRRTEALLAAGLSLPGPGIEEIMGTVREHLGLTMDYYGEETGVKVFRKFLIWYTRGFRNVKRLRWRVAGVATAAEAEELLEDMRRAAGEPALELP